MCTLYYCVFKLITVCCLVTKSCPTLVILWTTALQAPLSMGFPRQKYWSGLPFLSPGDLPDPGIKPTSPAGRFFTTVPPGKPQRRGYSQVFYLLGCNTSFVLFFFFLRMLKTKQAAPFTHWAPSIQAFSLVLEYTGSFLSQSFTWSSLFLKLSPETTIVGSLASFSFLLKCYLF